MQLFQDIAKKVTSGAKKKPRVEIEYETELASVSKKKIKHWVTFYVIFYLVFSQ